MRFPQRTIPNPDREGESMGITGPNINDILIQKVQDIQSRLPIQMSLVGDLKDSFANALAEASASASAAQSLLGASGRSETTDPVSGLAGAMLGVEGSTQSSSLSPSLQSALAARLLGTNPTSAYASTSATYPKLNAEQLNALMPRIDAAIAENAANTGIDPRLLRALVRQESSFQPFSVSTAGAMGLTQLMPDTAAGLGITDPYNVEENIRGGAKYLQQQLASFGGDTTLALAAYNAGPNAVKASNGVPPYAETRDFIQKVLSYYNMYRAVDQ